MPEYTTMRIAIETKAKLDGMREYPKQPYDEIVDKLIKWKEEGEDLLAVKKLREKRSG